MYIIYKIQTYLLLHSNCIPIYTRARKFGKLNCPKTSVESLQNSLNARRSRPPKTFARTRLRQVPISSNRIVKIKFPWTECRYTDTKPASLNSGVHLGNIPSTRGRIFRRIADWRGRNRGTLMTIFRYGFRNSAHGSCRNPSYQAYTSTRCRHCSRSWFLSEFEQET